MGQVPIAQKGEGLLNWSQVYGDYCAAHGLTQRYYVEHAAARVWWAFANDQPLGTYGTAIEAMQRCQEHFETSRAPE